jgi:ParB/Sulfiredoxin domain
MNEKMLLIQKTLDFDKFKLIRGNRDISKNRVNALKKSIERQNLLYLVPIAVNKDMEIVDGQHRWAAAKILNVPIYYVIANGVDLNDMIVLNAYQRSWNANDYLNLYVKQNLPEYKKLAKFADTYNISVPLALCVLTKTYTYSTGVREEFKSGNFLATHEKDAIETMEEVMRVRDYCVGFVVTDRTFLHAYVKMREQVELDRLLIALKKYKATIERRATRLDYLRQLEEIINKGKSTNLIRLY